MSKSAIIIGVVILGLAIAIAGIVISSKEATKKPEAILGDSPNPTSAVTPGRVRGLPIADEPNERKATPTPPVVTTPRNAPAPAQAQAPAQPEQPAVPRNAMDRGGKIFQSDTLRRKALEDPENPDNWLRLAQAYAKEGRPVRLVEAALRRGRHYSKSPGNQAAFDGMIATCGQESVRFVDLPDPVVRSGEAKGAGTPAVQR